MQPTNHLMLLVRSLSPAEKRYFKLFAKRHVQSTKSVYEKLFDAMDHWPHETYDEKLFIKTHRAKPFVKYFADEKRNLHELIMQAMRALNAEDTIDHQINELLADEDFFRKKRLNELRAKALEKAKKLAYQYEKYPSLITILDREINARIEWNQHELKEMYEKLGQEELMVSDSLSNSTKLKHINHRLFIQVRINTKLSSETLKAESQRAIDDPIVANYQPGQSFVADGYYYRTLSLHHRIHGNVELHKLYAQRAYELFEIEYPHHKASNPVGYRISLFNYLNACFVASDLAIFPQLLQKAKELKTNNADEEGEEWQNIIHLELIYFLNTGQLDKAMSLSPNIKAGLLKYKNKVNAARQLAITYNLAAAFFVSEKWEEALACYNTILMDTSNARTDLKENAELLLLAVHYELNNIVLLDNLITNLRRRFNGNGKQQYAEFFGSMKQLLKHKDSYPKTGGVSFGELPIAHKELNLWLRSINEKRSIALVFNDAYFLTNGAAKQ